MAEDVPIAGPVARSVSPLAGQAGLFADRARVAPLARRAWAAAAAVAAGLLYTLACPPYDLWLAAWAVPGLLLAPMRGLRPRDALLCGLVFALAMGCGVTGWAYATSRAYFGLGPATAAGFVLLVWLAFGGVQYALLCAAYAAVAPATPLRWRGLVGAWLWVVAEILRARLFTGMPWELVGHTQHGWLALVQIADLGGVYAVSFVVAWASVGAAEAIAAAASGLERRWARLLALVGAPGIALGAALAYGSSALVHYRMPSAPEDARVVAVVQGNVASTLGWQRVHAERALIAYVQLTEQALARSPDIVVWPEYATPLYLDSEPLLLGRVRELARRSRDGLLVGAPRLTGEAEARNSALLFGADGALVGAYDKRRLVPIAETSLLGIGAAGEGEPVFRAGSGPQILAAGATHLGATICYEVVFPHLVRDLVLAGAELLVNLTNESWLEGGNGAAPRQQFSMAVFRAIETRRALARAASTGLSGFVSPAGDVLQALPSGVAGVAVERLPLRRELTPYVRWGETWVALVGVLGAAIAVAGRLRRGP
jgi:apolipoprotein N-acyltransferase